MTMVNGKLPMKLWQLLTVINPTDELELSHTSIQQYSFLKYTETLNIGYLKDWPQ